MMMLVGSAQFSRYRGRALSVLLAVLIGLAARFGVARATPQIDEPPRRSFSALRRAKQQGVLPTTFHISTWARTEAVRFCLRKTES